MVAHYLPVDHQHDQHGQDTHNPGRKLFCNTLEQLLAVRAEVDAILTPILYDQQRTMRTKTTNGTPSCQIGLRSDERLESVVTIAYSERPCGYSVMGCNGTVTVLKRFNVGEGVRFSLR